MLVQANAPLRVRPWVEASACRLSRAPLTHEVGSRKRREDCRARVFVDKQPTNRLRCK